MSMASEVLKLIFAVLDASLNSGHCALRSYYKNDSFCALILVVHLHYTNTRV